MDKIAIIGIGVVGLQLTVKLSEHYPVMAYDINPKRIKDLKNANDRNLLFEPKILKNSKIQFCEKIADIESANIYILSVPTDVMDNQQPNLEPLILASSSIGKILKKQDIVIVQSSVFPRMTEDYLVPILEKESGLKLNKDFFVAYSPDRYSPQDDEYLMENICKVISVSHPSILKKVQTLYQKICHTTYLAPSIAVAECSKMLENIQRNINIALMNEFSQITHALDISLDEVIQASSTKHNFHVYHPGFVGGYCIPVNSSYMIYQALKHQVYPELMLSALRVNEGMPEFVFKEFLKLYFKHLKNCKQPRIGLFGLGFKPNIQDTRHSLSLVLLELMKEFDIHPLIHDPYTHESIHSNTLEEMKDLDVCILLVKHQAYIDLGIDYFNHLCKKNACIMDVAQLFTNVEKSSQVHYWVL